MPTHGTVCGLLLAGGRSRRMNGIDKALLPIGGITLLGRVIATAIPQVGPLVINTNADPGKFAVFGYPVAADVIPGHAGPLAGILTGLEWTRVHAPMCEWVASFACDTPFVPRDLVTRMLAEASAPGVDMVCARSGDRDHPVFGLWPVGLAADLRHALVDENIRKVDDWTRRFRLAKAAFDTRPVDPFFNINRPQDRDFAETVLSAQN